MSKKKSPELRVFKLRSGEEIIAKIVGKSRGKIKLQRPLKILNNMVSDPYTGMKKHVVYFCDWLGCTTELVADIPTDFIVVDLPPDPDMVSLYSRQLEAQDTGNTALPHKTPLGDDLPPLTDEELKLFISSIDKQLEDIYKQYDEEMGKGKKPPKSPKPNSVGPFGVMPPMGPPLPPPGILFSVAIPNEVMNQWLENGILDYLKDCMEDFIDMDMDDLFDDQPPKKKSKKPVTKKDKSPKWKEPSEEDKKKPGFGNSITDWSPFVKDYLDDKPQPPKENKE
jgi:hypothetical protein